MPTCAQCGTHWFNPVSHKCPVCGAPTVEALAGALADQLRHAPKILTRQRLPATPFLGD